MFFEIELQIFLLWMKKKSIVASSFVELFHISEALLLSFTNAHLEMKRNQ